MFPVQVTSQVLPPYSVYPADYVAPGSNRLSLFVFLADVNRPELRVRLRVRLEGQGVVVQTRPNYLPPPIILQGGLTEQLTGFDIADYFNPENLDFQGITRQQYQRDGRLPEGIYRFCFEVLEYNRGVTISNTSCAVAWLILNDPPLLNQPALGSTVNITYPQNLVFQWTPRHTGSPNSAFNVEYDFTLVELWPKGRNS